MTTLKYINTFLLLFALTITQTGCGQNNSDNIEAGAKYAREALKKSLTDSTLHNVINRQDTLIKDKQTAIRIAESILFDIYGAKEIKWQRPYDAYNVDNYWVINGTLPKGYKGGTFLIILDAHDSRVVRISHGK